MKFVHLLLLLTALFVLTMGCSSNNEVKEGPLFSDKEMMATADQQFAAGKYLDALNTYQSLLMEHPTSDLHIDTQLKIAAVYGKMENYEAQMDALHTLLSENIIPRQIPNIYVQIGQFYEQAARFNPGTVTTDTSDYQTAISYYQKAFNYKDSEDSTAKAEAGYRKALTEARIGQVSEAVKDYQLVVDQFPQTDFAVLASVKLTNPNDVSELKTDPASIESYRQTLALPEPSTGNMVPQEPTPVESVEPAPQVEEPPQSTEEPSVTEEQESSEGQDAQNTLFETDSTTVAPAVTDSLGGQ